MPLTRIVGRYDMRPIGDDENRVSWEDFIVTRNPDGSRTAMSMSRFPGCSIVRHVVQTVDADFTPLDGFVRLFAHNQYAGGLVRHVSGDEVHSILLPGGGLPPEATTIAIDAGREVLGYHPTTAEGWKLMKLDRSRSDVQQIDLLTVSLTWNGGTLDHGRKASMPVEYLGRDTITVKAGTFECDHFMWHTGNLDGNLEIWTTGEDAVVARMLGHDKGFCYELASYEVTEFGDEHELMFRPYEE